MAASHGPLVLMDAAHCPLMVQLTRCVHEINQILGASMVLSQCCHGIVGGFWLHSSPGARRFYTHGLF